MHYDAPEAGKTKVESDGGAVAARSEQTFAGTFTVSIGDQTLKGEVRQQGMNVALDLGRLVLRPGEFDIKVEAGDITGKELMLLKSLTLLPVQ